MVDAPWWKREMKEIFSISSTFFILFILFTLLKMATLGKYDISGFKTGSVIIGSLILGKVVLIFDKLPLTRKMDFLPNIYRVFFRSLIYLLGYVIFTLIEHWIKGLIDEESFVQAWMHAFQQLGTKDYILSLVIIFISFLFFNTFWVIRLAYGPKALFDLFFKKED